MHAKTDSEVTSLAPSSPPRSPRRPIYYVMSPSQPDPEKMSLGGGSSLGGSPLHHHHHHHQPHPYHHRYISSPLHHSRESSTNPFSASLKNASSWSKIPAHRHRSAADDDEEEEEVVDRTLGVRCYVVLFVLGFTILFTVFSVILWGASRAYKPQLAVKSVVFESYNIQAGMDLTGVPTKMLSINSTVKIWFKNRATFFGVHVSATPVELFWDQLKIASGEMKEFYESRETGRVVSITVSGTQVPLYGGGSSLSSRSDGGVPAVVPLNLTFEVRARAHVLGKLVRSTFYRRVRCSLFLRESRLGKPLRRVRNACQYHS